MKRKLKKKYKLLIFGLIIAIIGGSIIIFLPKNKSQFVISNKIIHNKEEVKEVWPKVSTISLVATGDGLLHNAVYMDAYNRNTKTFNFDSQLTMVKDIISGYDLAYYNQETILGGEELGVSSYPAFNSPYEVGDAMIDAGFNLVSLATNHTMDRGEKAVLSSVEYWKQHEDEVLAVGSYSSFEERDKVRIKSINGITYTMLNYTYGTNGIAVPKGKEYLCNVWPTDLNINDPSRDKEYQACYAG